MAESWQEKIKHAPRAPGVYIMKDSDDVVMYVGKAKDLRLRSRSYLHGSDNRAMIPFLTSKIYSVDFMVTKTEKEALILENNLLKAHRPRYNVTFRDDKTYYSLRIDTQRTPFPRYQLVRQVKKDGARYFGPYPSSAAAKETLHFLQPIFPLRTCSDREYRSRKRPCLEHQIKRCLAPCVGRVERDAYRQIVTDSMAFLEGKETHLLADLSSRMKRASVELRFEEAAVLRDRIAAIETTLEKQRVVSTESKDQDVIGIHREGGNTQVVILQVRRGKLLAHRTFPPVTLGAGPEEVVSALITQYYDSAWIPQEIYIPHSLGEQPVIREWLAEKKGGPVTLHVPKRGRARELMALAISNAVNALSSELASKMDCELAVRQLAELLHLKKRPETIECFDISNIAGMHGGGSMVTFRNGQPFKRGYRRFRIAGDGKADDYGMMREVLGRRYGKKEALPDLVVVDGGKGQVHVATALLADLGIQGIDVIGLAKRRSIQSRGPLDKSEDRVYLHGRKNPLYLSRWPAALHLLQQIRDEAHRFAISYHRKLKDQRDFHSLLEDLKGVGEARKKALLSHFGDLERIRASSQDELQQVRGIGPDLASRIQEFLQTPRPPFFP